LIHGFSRSVGFILPPRSPGIDLVIPVLRSDNLMSCVAIQIKNDATDAFPSTPKEINRKLSIDYLKFLDFGKIGEFEAAPWDEFVRIVIQFREKKEFELDQEYFSCWEPIIGSRSMNDKVKNCHSLWILGLDFFEDSLFFNNEEIIKNLNTILSGQRDFLTAIDFPKVLLPTKLQTSEVGARFLTNAARSMSNHQNILIEDESLRAQFKDVYENYQKLMEELQIPQNAKCFKDNFKITTVAKSKIVEVVDEKSVELNTENIERSQNSKESQESHKSQKSQESQESFKSQKSTISSSSTDLDDTETIEYKRSVLTETITENAAYARIDSQIPKRQALDNFNKKLNDFKDKFYNESMKKRNLALLKYKNTKKPVKEDDGEGCSGDPGCQKRSTSEISDTTRTTRNIKPKYKD